MKFSVGLDVRMLPNTGIGTYLKGLLDGLRKTDNLPPKSFCLAGASKDKTGYPELTHLPFGSKIYSISEQLEYPWKLGQVKLWHSPHYNVPLYKGKTKLVVTIHDLIHWVFRKDFFNPLQTIYSGRMISHAVKTADHIISVSGKTKDDLILHFDADPDKISVIHEGVSDIFRPPAQFTEIANVRAKYGLPESFFIYVGMLKPHKNVLWLIHLFRKLRAEGKINSSLVLVGRKDKKYPSGYEGLSKLKSEDGIIHIPRVELPELIALYNGALALIHPSLYEGFGLTLLEAMACGTPVIACRAASIPEVVGDAGYLVGSCEEREMADAITRFEKVPSLRDHYIRKGIYHAAQFRWETMAEKTAEIYEKVLSQS